MDTRIAIVTGPRLRGIDAERANQVHNFASQVRAYLPGNYKVVTVGADERNFASVVIAGQDSAGWTLDGYVIPRLASGMIFAKEFVSHD